MDTKIKIEEIKSALKIDEKRKQIAQIENEMQAAGFWDDKELASQRKELNAVRARLEKEQKE